MKIPTQKNIFPPPHIQLRIYSSDISRRLHNTEDGGLKARAGDRLALHWILRGTPRGQTEDKNISGSWPVVAFDIIGVKCSGTDSRVSYGFSLKGKKKPSHVCHLSCVIVFVFLFVVCTNRVAYLLIPLK